MIRFVVFLMALTAVGVFDIAAMRSRDIKRELAPYLIIGAAAVFSAVMAFLSPFHGSMLDAILRLLRI